MKEWKLRQQIFHKTHPIDDYIEQIEHVVDYENIVDKAVQYFTDPNCELSFPAKSYAVAIIYAFLLTKHFKEDFYEALNDPALLYHNDKYFLPYYMVPEIYDKIISLIPKHITTSKNPNVNATINYFKQEFGIED